MNAAAPSQLVIERVLRDREGIWRQILSGDQLAGLIGKMLVSSVVSLAIYGAVLGASADYRQALSSAVKLPLLFLLTLAICLPTLYLFNLVFGARLSIRQALSLILVAITVTGALTLAFAPITLFFLVTAHDYSFFKLLNVAVLLLTGIVGLTFMVDGMRALNRLSGHPDPAPHPGRFGPPPGWGPAGQNYPPFPHRPAGAPIKTASTISTPNGTSAPATTGAAVATKEAKEATEAKDAKQVQDASAPAVQPAPGALERPVSTRLLQVWILLFGFVGTQLAWTLRPFVGEPHTKFALFRAIDGNFYENIVHTLGQLF